MRRGRRRKGGNGLELQNEQRRWRYETTIVIYVLESPYIPLHSQIRPGVLVLGGGREGRRRGGRNRLALWNEGWRGESE